MRITVLGGCGFIGSAIVAEMLSDGHQVTVFDYKNVNKQNISVFLDKINFVGGDFLNPEELSPAIQNAEIVFHLASTTLPGSSLKSPTYDIETNVVSSIHLMEKCLSLNVRKLVFISSGGTVYGVPEQIPIKESNSLNPITPYGLSKLTIEKYLAFYKYHYGLDYSVVRLSNPYGSKQNPHSGQGVIASWVHKIRHNESIEMWGDGEVVRDYIYIDDAVKAMKAIAFSSTDHQVFNVGSGVGHSLNQLHKIIEECLGQKINVSYKPTRKVDVPVNILDTSLILDSLGWQATTSLREGIIKTWQALN